MPEVTDAAAGQNVLDVPMSRNDAGAKTIREYLRTLLLKVYEEQGEFSGKRPFGYSGWDVDLHIALGEAGLIGIEYDSDGYVMDADSDSGDELIRQAIRTLQ